MTSRVPGADRVVLLGVMGTGKSSVGRLLASKLGWAFWDNDDRLVEEGGRTAADIVRAGGADALHRREAAVLLEGLDQTGPAVVAAAASTILNSEVRDRLRSDGLVIWLHAAPEVLQRRLVDPGDRPFLGSSPARVAAELQQARADLYRAVADRDVDTTDRSPEAIAEDLSIELSGSVAGDATTARPSRTETGRRRSC